jgi:hypothetical protein
MYYDSEGYFNIVAEGRESFKTQSFRITITINTEEMKGDSILLVDLADLDVNIDVECTLYVEDTTNFYKKINFYNTNNVSEEIYTGQFQWGCRYYNASTKERLIHISIPQIRFSPVEFPTSPEPGVIMQTIAGIAQKASSAVTFVSGYSTTAYVIGDFDTPDDTLDMTEFCPVVDAAGKADLFCGTENWEAGGVGEGQAYVGQSVAGTPGAIKFSVTSGNWTTFAVKSMNGMKTIKMPKVANNDQLGGDISMMYNYLAFYYAFTADASDILVTNDGSVFKGSISAANLVVSGAGIIGLAGGNPTATSAEIIECVVKNAVATDLG